MTAAAIPADILDSEVAHHGEGAYWDPTSQQWLSVDMLASRVVLTDPAGRSTRRDLPDTVAAAVRPVEGGGRWLVVGRRRLWALPAEGPPRTLLELDVGSGCRANEAALDRHGGLAVGTMSYDAAPGMGRVVSVSADGRRRVALSGTTVSNGTVFEEGGTVLFVDSPTGMVVRHAVRSDGTWAEPVPAVDLRGEPGVPDGICCDSEGGVWVALWGAGEVQRWDGGRRTHVVRLPVSQPTSVALGGADGNDLLVTSSAYELAPGHGTPAGSLFIARAPAPAADHRVLPGSTMDAWESLRQRRAGGA